MVGNNGLQKINVSLEGFWLFTFREARYGIMRQIHIFPEQQDAMFLIIFGVAGLGVGQFGFDQQEGGSLLLEPDLLDAFDLAEEISDLCGCQSVTSGSIPIVEIAKFFAELFGKSDAFG